jgi:superfamily II DNA/RNA helicase
LEKGPRQVVFASATVSRHMRKIASDYFGDGTDPAFRFKELIEKSTHMNLQHLKHEFVSLADFDKVKPLKLLMKEFTKYAKKHNTSCIVFCNSVNAARAIEHALREEKIKTASMHGDIPPRIRERNFENFKAQIDGT